MATYTNSLTKEKYTLYGVSSLEKAWKLVSFVARRNDWNEMDITVKYIN